MPRHAAKELSNQATPTEFNPSSARHGDVPYRDFGFTCCLALDWRLSRFSFSRPCCAAISSILMIRNT